MFAGKLFIQNSLQENGILKCKYGLIFYSVHSLSAKYILQVVCLVLLEMLHPPPPKNMLLNVKRLKKKKTYKDNNDALLPLQNTDPTDLSLLHIQYVYLYNSISCQTE